MRNPRSNGKKASGLLTVGEVAEVLQVTEETVRRYIREGKLKAEKRKQIGLKKVWMVAQEELHRFSEA